MPILSVEFNNGEKHKIETVMADDVVALEITALLTSLKLQIEDVKAISRLDVTQAAAE